MYKVRIKNNKLKIKGIQFKVKNKHNFKFTFEVIENNNWYAFAINDVLRSKKHTLDYLVEHSGIKKEKLNIILNQLALIFYGIDDALWHINYLQPLLLDDFKGRIEPDIKDQEYTFLLKKF